MDRRVAPFLAFCALSLSGCFLIVALDDVRLADGTADSGRRADGPASSATAAEQDGAPADGGARDAGSDSAGADSGVDAGSNEPRGWPRLLDFESNVVVGDRAFDSQTIIASASLVVVQQGALHGASSFEVRAAPSSKGFGNLAIPQPAPRTIILSFLARFGTPMSGLLDTLDIVSERRAGGASYRVLTADGTSPEGAPRPCPVQHYRLLTGSTPDGELFGCAKYDVTIRLAFVVRLDDGAMDVFFAPSSTEPLVKKLVVAHPLDGPTALELGSSPDTTAGQASVDLDDIWMSASHLP